MVLSTACSIRVNNCLCGGDFSRVGAIPVAGQCRSDDRVAVATYPKFDDPISAAASDGAGGWYVSLAGSGRMDACWNIKPGTLKHILANGTVDTVPGRRKVLPEIIFDSARNAVIVAAMAASGPSVPQNQIMDCGIR